MENITSAPAMENSFALSPVQQAALDRITALRNPEAHYLVYKITGPTGKIYIGYTGNSLARRWNSGGYDNYYFREDLDRYGKKNFRKEILCEHLTKEGALHLEYELIERLHARDAEVGYNSLTGGPASNSHAAERSRMNRSVIETPSGRYLKASEATKRYYAEHPETVKAVAEKLRLRYANSPELVEACRRTSKAPKPIRCVETGEVYPSLNKCAAAMHVTNSALLYAANHPESICCGCHWERLKTQAETGSNDESVPYLKEEATRGVPKA